MKMMARYKRFNCFHRGRCGCARMPLPSLLGQRSLTELVAKWKDRPRRCMSCLMKCFFYGELTNNQAKFGERETFEFKRCTVVFFLLSKAEQFAFILFMYETTYVKRL